MAGMAISSHGTMALIALAQTAKEPQAKAAAEFHKLDAATLPIIKKIQIGGDADWLGVGFGSVWVTVAKNNEVVRVDPVRNVVQAQNRRGQRALLRDWHRRGPGVGAQLPRQDADAH